MRLLSRSSRNSLPRRRPRRKPNRQLHPRARVVEQRRKLWGAARLPTFLVCFLDSAPGGRTTFPLPAPAPFTACGAQMTRTASIRIDVVNLVDPRGLTTFGPAGSNKIFLQLDARAGRIGDKPGAQIFFALLQI